MPPNEETLSIYLSHRGELINYASRILGDRAHAEDVVQEAFLRFDSASEKSSVGEPVSYLYRIVRNLSLDVLRKLNRDRDRQVPDAGEMIELVEQDVPSPERQARGRQELRLLSDAMDELPERTRIALEMHRIGGCSFKEIARHLNVSVGTAHSLVIQGLEHCRDRLYRR